MRCYDEHGMNKRNLKVLWRHKNISLFHGHLIFVRFKRAEIEDINVIVIFKTIQNKDDKKIIRVILNWTILIISSNICKNQWRIDLQISIPARSRKLLWNTFQNFFLQERLNFRTYKYIKNRNEQLKTTQ